MIHSRRIASLAATAVALTAACALGADNIVPPIKPGLWQVNSEQNVNGKQMPTATASMQNLPPEVRARMADMMKARGVDMSGAGGTRVCLSRESLDQGQWQSVAKDCTTKIISRSSSSWKWHSSCPQTGVESDGETLFTNAENYTLKMVTTMNVAGKPSISQRTMTGKWLGADCGDIKPVTAKSISGK
jgi:hypothetical protein